MVGLDPSTELTISRNIADMEELGLLILHQWERKGSVLLSSLVCLHRKIILILMKQAYLPCGYPIAFFSTVLIFYCSAPPDHGLATKPMAGKKSDKFHITLGLACNSDGSEKLPPLFIGRSQKPVYFKRKSPQTEGFLYYNNKKSMDDYGHFSRVCLIMFS